MAEERNRARNLVSAAPVVHPSSLNGARDDRKLGNAFAERMFGA